MSFISVLIGFIAGLIAIMLALRAIADFLVFVVGLLGFFLVYAVVEHMAFGFFLTLVSGFAGGGIVVILCLPLLPYTSYFEKIEEFKKDLKL